MSTFFFLSANNQILQAPFWQQELANFHITMTCRSIIKWKILAYYIIGELGFKLKQTWIYLVRKLCNHNDWKLFCFAVGYPQVLVISYRVPKESLFIKYYCLLEKCLHPSFIRFSWLKAFMQYDCIWKFRLFKNNVLIRLR